ncbi:MAG: polysaccharide deacetylase family protein [Pseudomonadota bacterium]
MADPWNMAVSPENFAAHLEVMKGYAVPRTMRDFAANLSNTHAAKRSIAVTFDDGYIDNLTRALPLLEVHDVPATVFVVSGAIGKPDAFWWDLLTKVFLETPNLPQVLTLESPDGARSFDLSANAAYDHEAMARSAAWRADWTAPQDGRQRVFLDVWQHTLSLPGNVQAETARKIAAWAGLADADRRPDGARPMDQDALDQLAASPLIEIGGHTATHPDLSQVAPATATDEIARGRRNLMDMTGKPVDSFAYPFGRYTAQTADHIRDAGFSCAGWSRPGLATPKSDPFALPRLQVPNLKVDDFDALLRDTIGPPLARI